MPRPTNMKSGIWTIKARGLGEMINAGARGRETIARHRQQKIRAYPIKERSPVAARSALVLSARETSGTTHVYAELRRGS